MPNDPEVLRERLRKAREAKAAKVAATPPEPAPAGDDPIADLMASLQQIQSKKVSESKALDDLASILDRIDPIKNPEVFDTPAIEAFLEKIGEARAKKDRRNLPPGAIRGDGNPNSPTAQDVQWKLADVNRREDGTKELITWAPAETTLVIYNGVQCQCIADVEMTTEKAFYDVYMEHRRLTREAEQRKAYMFGRTTTPPPNEGTDGGGSVAAARVRAFTGMGGEGGGGRILVGYPGDARFELRDVPGGEQPSGETTQQ